MSNMQVLSAYQGRQYNRILQINNTTTGAPATGVFLAGTTLSASVWEGQNQATIFSPAVSWAKSTPTVPVQTGYDQGQVALSIAASQTATLDPSGEYYLLIDETTQGVTAPVIECRLKILATPGSVVQAPPDLITYDYAEAQLTDANLTDAQRDNLPYLVSAASQAVRVFCKDRYFDLRTVSEKYDVALNGEVRLYQVPILQILRVQGQPALALTVANNSQSVQAAQAYFTFTGVPGGYATNAQTATGMYLTWVSNGTPANATVPYTANMTVSQLATAIAATGSGWTATANSGYGNWPVTELDGGFVGQGCALSAIPGDGAQFNVLLDLTDTYLDNPNRGFLWVGRQTVNSNALRWGPGGDQLFGSSSGTQYQLGQVKVTYQAGHAIIPSEVQYWTAQLVKWFIEVSKQELLLMEEKAADYSYKLSEEMVHRMPKTVREGLAPYRLHYA
jgi:hypothetical protein